MIDPVRGNQKVYNKVGRLMWRCNVRIIIIIIIIYWHKSKKKHAGHRGCRLNNDHALV